MSVSKSVFGSTGDGTVIESYRIENSKKMAIEVITFGAILKNVFVKDANGNVKDMVMGYDNLEMYLGNGSCFGATVGPIANRTNAGKFVLDGIEYQIPVNDRGLNNLHTDLDNGFHKRVWAAKVNEADNSVCFSLTKKDGEMGHPGNLSVNVTYTLTEDNEVKIHYHVDTDKKTVINMTDHSYFNLSGADSDNMEDTVLTIYASNYTPVREDAIPTGQIAPVEGTPMDFTKGKAIKTDIEKKDFDQIKICGGYDHNYAIDGYDGSLRLAAKAVDNKSGRSLEVYTDLPGVQFYAGNFIGEETGKEGFTNKARMGFCLETQHYPDAVNQPAFPSSVYSIDKPYDSTTIYKFV